MGRPFPCAGFYYGGWDFELAIDNRQCNDTGAAPALRVGGGVKYFVTRSIGLGGGVNFALGPAFHGASDCFNSYTDFYGAFDFQLGAEFIF